MKKMSYFFCMIMALTSCISKDKQEIAIIGQVVIIGSEPFTQVAIKRQRNDDDEFFLISPPEIARVLHGEQGYLIEFRGNFSEKQDDLNISRKGFIVTRWKKIEK